MTAPKLNYANIAATVALLVVFGGTASLAIGKPEAAQAQAARTVAGTVQVYQKKYTLPSPTPLGYFSKFTVLCPEGKKAIAGGGLGVINISASYPTQDAFGTAPGTNPDTFKGWTVSGNVGPLVIGGHQWVYVVCMT